MVADGKCAAAYYHTSQQGNVVYLSTNKPKIIEDQDSPQYNGMKVALWGIAMAIEETNGQCVERENEPFETHKNDLRKIALQNPEY